MREVSWTLGRWVSQSRNLRPSRAAMCLERLLRVLRLVQQVAPSLPTVRRWTSRGVYVQLTRREVAFGYRRAWRHLTDWMEASAEIFEPSDYVVLRNLGSNGPHSL